VLGEVISLYQPYCYVADRHRCHGDIHVLLSCCSTYLMSLYFHYLHENLEIKMGRHFLSASLHLLLPWFWGKLRSLRSNSNSILILWLLQRLWQRWAWTGSGLDIFRIRIGFGYSFLKTIGSGQDQDVGLISMTKFSWEWFKWRCHNWWWQCFLCYGFYIVSMCCTHHNQS